jgi:hypothetical protein
VIAMTATRYAGSFTLDSWDQHDEPPADGLRRSRALVSKTFGGDLVGTSRTELLLAIVEGGPSSYCGFEQFTGTVAGRSGSFVLRHAAEAAAVARPGADGSWLTWQVLAGSGRGELAGVQGEGQITRHNDGSHTYWLDLSL